MHGKPQSLLSSLIFLGQGQGTKDGVTTGFVVLPCSLLLIAHGTGDKSVASLWLLGFGSMAFHPASAGPLF